MFHVSSGKLKHTDSLTLNYIQRLSRYRKIMLYPNKTLSHPPPISFLLSPLFNLIQYLTCCIDNLESLFCWYIKVLYVCAYVSMALLRNCFVFEKLSLGVALTRRRPDSKNSRLWICYLKQITRLMALLNIRAWEKNDRVFQQHSDSRMFQLCHLNNRVLLLLRKIQNTYICKTQNPGTSHTSLKKSLLHSMFIFWFKNKLNGSCNEYQYW